MGVGKSSVARHLSTFLECTRVDLDQYIEKETGQKIPEIFRSSGEAAYRKIETECLRSVLNDSRARIVSLGGGAWIVEENRNIIAECDVTSVWLESTFDHCWQNISQSRRERPLAKNKDAARELFEARQGIYALADWHFIVRPGFSSYDIASQINDQVFG